MEIVIIGSESQLKEAQSKFGDSHQYSLFPNRQNAESILKSTNVVFDFLIGDSSSQLNIYQPFHSLVVFLDTSFLSLTSLKTSDFKSMFIGFCGLATFLNREILEVSLLSRDQERELKRICKELNTPYRVVADKVGLVTPRVICMIINEAYCTVEEGTASKDDIDKAMKLGTNYPFGPFEWCERIGKLSVSTFLESMHRSTGDNRYKVSKLLKSESLK
jgi:3-hydroxybutyryl-CoA dehydrogenase